MYRYYRSAKVSWQDNQTAMQLESQLSDAVLLVESLKVQLMEHRAKCESVEPTADEFSDSSTQREMWDCLPDAVKDKLWGDYQQAIHDSACNMTASEVDAARK